MKNKLLAGVWAFGYVLLEYIIMVVAAIIVIPISFIGVYKELIEDLNSKQKNHD